jgi:hypothetical protein
VLFDLPTRDAEEEQSPQPGIVDLRTNVDGWGEGPVSGVYDPSLGGWRFDLETGRYVETGVAFKFFVHPSSWRGR